MKCQKDKHKRNSSKAEFKRRDPSDAFLKSVRERMLSNPVLKAVLRLWEQHKQRAISKMMVQFRNPTGRQGRHVAKLNQGHRSLTLWGLSKVEIASHDRILDVGCGGGITLSKLAQMAPQGRVFGIDFSPDMVEYSKKLNKNLIAQNRVEIACVSVEKMSFLDDDFDLVTAFETYYFWPNINASLREIKRVLKPGGSLLLVNEMVKDGVYEVANSKMISESYVRLIPLAELQNVMLAVGFVDVRVFTEPDSPWNAVLAKKP
jgi:SAM-dependent methyltransferase